MTTVYVHHEDRARWCVVRAAHPGGRIWLGCGAWIAYAPVLIGTRIAAEFVCAACRAASEGPTAPDVCADQPDDGAFAHLDDRGKDAAP